MSAGANQRHLHLIASTTEPVSAQAKQQLEHLRRLGDDAAYALLWREVTRECQIPPHLSEVHPDRGAV